MKWSESMGLDLNLIWNNIAVLSDDKKLFYIFAPLIIPGMARLRYDPLQFRNKTVKTLNWRKVLQEEIPFYWIGCERESGLTCCGGFCKPLTQIRTYVYIFYIILWNEFISKQTRAITSSSPKRVLLKETETVPCIPIILISFSTGNHVMAAAAGMGWWFFG